MNSHHISKKLEDAKKSQGYFESGKAYYEQKQYLLTIEDCSKALDIDPYNTEALIYLGLACFMEEDAYGAILNFEKALHLNTDKRETCHYYLGIIYHQNSHLDPAAHHLKNAVESNLKNNDYREALARVYLDKGISHFKNKNFARAREYFDVCCSHSTSGNGAGEEAKKQILQINAMQALQNILIEEKNNLVEAADRDAHPYRVNLRDLTLLKELGKGTYAKVYQGKYKEKDLAIKCMEFKNVIPHGEFLSIRKEREILSSLTKLAAPGVIAFFGYTFTKTTFMLLIELMPNGILTNALKKLRGPQQKQIMINLCDALKFLHGKDINIVHCDLKPDNVLLTATWEAKLGDFGLSYRKGVDTPESVNGTPVFLAPELLLGNPNDFASDVYALGTTFWCIVAEQKSPFSYLEKEADGFEKLRTLVAYEDKREPIPLHCPANIKYVIENSWLFAASQRLTAAEMKNKLEEPEPLAEKAAAPAGMTL